MTQAYTEVTSALHEMYESSTDQMANLVAVYRRVVGNNSNVSMHENEQGMCLVMDLSLLGELAQFDKLLAVLK
jgi:hypothetical protein